MIYLATPYTHPDIAVMEARFRAVNRAAAALMREGHHVFSPISHTHPIAIEGDLPRDWAFWETYDRAFLRICTRVVVLQLPGWELSTGVTAEIAIAEELGLPVEYRFCVPSAVELLLLAEHQSNFLDADDVTKWLRCEIPNGDIGDAGKKWFDAYVFDRKDYE